MFNTEIALIVTAVKRSAQASAPLRGVATIVQDSFLLVTHSKQGYGIIRGLFSPLEGELFEADSVPLYPW